MADDKGNSTIQGDLTGRDSITSGSAGRNASDIVAAKLRAKQLEIEAEAKAEAEIAAAAARAATEGHGTVIYQSGGIGNIGQGGGNVHIGGNVIGGSVGGDANVTNTKVTSTGMTAEDFAKIFETINAKVEKVSPAVKEDVHDAVETIKAEAQKEAVEGKPPDEKAVKMSSQALVSMAPDILEVAAATLANPAAGVALIIRKVLDRAKAMGSSAA